MRRLLRWLSVLVLLGIPLALGAAAYLSFQDQPLVRRAVLFTPEDVERAMRILEKHDPRRMKSGTLRETAGFPAFDQPRFGRFPLTGVVSAA